MKIIISAMLVIICLVTVGFAQAPAVVSTFPPQNALNILANTDISVTFDIAMDENSINDTTVIVNGNYMGYYDGTIAYDALTRTATFDPDNDFKAGETIAVTLTDGIESSEGAGLERSYSWYFIIGVKPSSSHFINSWTSPRFASGICNICTGELSCDTCLDLAVANRGAAEVAVLTNDCTANSYIFTSNGIDRGTDFIIAADINRDGKQDLITANTYANTITINYNDTSCAYSFYVSFDVGYDPTSACPADFDGDGDLDIAVAASGSSWIKLLLNIDGYSFDETEYPIGTPPISVIAPDIDNDGDFDIVSSNDVPGANFSVLLNDGFGVFSHDATYNYGYQSKFISMLDCDQDGDMDFVASIVHPAIPNDSIAILINDGGDLVAGPKYASGEGVSCVIAGDFDGDSDMDLAAADDGNDGGEIYIFRNLGYCQFESLCVVQTGLGPEGVRAGDFDNDGDLDLAAACNGDRTVVVHLNIGYAYVPGDANMYYGDWRPAVIGSDVTYLVNFFRGSPSNPACLLNGFYAAADINGDCAVIGSDVTRLVNIFRGQGVIAYCPDYPPLWLIPADCPEEAPPGWPNCE